METIQFEFRKPNNEETFSYSFSPSENTNIFSLANPKKYLKSDFVKYCYFTLPNNPQPIPMCKKKKDGSENCTKIPPKNMSKSRFTLIKATDSLISRKDGKDNNIMNHFYILGNLQYILDRLNGLSPQQAMGEKIDIKNIKFRKLSYKNTQQGGLPIVIIVISVVVYLLICLACIVYLKSSTSNSLDSFYCSYVLLDLLIRFLSAFGGGGGEEIPSQTKIQVIRQFYSEVGGYKGIMKLKDKIIHNSFFPLGNNYYIFIKFSKNKLLQTMIEAPFIVQVSPHAKQQMQQFNAEYVGKATNIVTNIQNAITQASQQQPQKPKSWWKRMSPKSYASSKLDATVQKLNQMVSESVAEYEGETPQTPKSGIF